MINLLIFIVGLIVGFVVAWVWGSRNTNEVKREMGRLETEIKVEWEMWYGFSEYNEKMALQTSSFA